MRREFSLAEPDVEYLDSRGLPWESVLAGSTQWLLVHLFPVPAGYNQITVTAALLIPPQYPDAQIDMVYLFPALERSDRKVIPNLAPQTIDGKEYQRWSRHPNADEKWRIGVDSIATHLVKVGEWLRREFRVRP